MSKFQQYSVKCENIELKCTSPSPTPDSRGSIVKEITETGGWWLSPLQTKNLFLGRVCIFKGGLEQIDSLAMMGGGESSLRYSLHAVTQM